MVIVSAGLSESNLKKKKRVEEYMTLYSSYSIYLEDLLMFLMNKEKCS